MYSRLKVGNQQSPSEIQSGVRSFPLVLFGWMHSVSLEIPCGKPSTVL